MVIITRTCPVVVLCRIVFITPNVMSKECIILSSRILAVPPYYGWDELPLSPLQSPCACRAHDQLNPRRERIASISSATRSKVSDFLLPFVFRRTWTCTTRRLVGRSVVFSFDLFERWKNYRSRKIRANAEEDDSRGFDSLLHFLLLSHKSSSFSIFSMIYACSIPSWILSYSSHLLETKRRVLLLLIHLASQRQNWEQAIEK